MRYGSFTPEPLERRVMLTLSVADFVDTLVGGGGLEDPVAMDFAPDGRIFVTEQAGQVRVIKDGQTLSTPFVTVDVNSAGERGLLGITLDPDFANNGFVYVYYTATSPTLHNRVSRFTAAGDVAAAGSETVLLDLDPLSSATNHNGGGIHFGPDGKLYVTQGDNANGPAAQALADRFGKVLRINPDGSIPSDNPFFNTATGDNRSIWALGLRNPFTFAFHPTTGRMFINDVGSNQFEEVNEGVAGANYGWPSQEGPPSSNPAFTPAEFFYGRQSGMPIGFALTGGAFYDGPVESFPAEYADDYFFADISARWIWKLDAATGTATEFATNLGGPVDLKVGPDGSLYYVAYVAGEVRKIAFDESAPPPPAVDPPVISAQPVAISVLVGQPASFTVAASGQGFSYKWQRDGVDIAGATSGTYTLAQTTPADSGAQFRAVVTNAGGSVTSDAAVLTVVQDVNNAAPVGTIVAPAEGRQFRAGREIRFIGTATDAEDGRLRAQSFTWRVDVHREGVVEPLVESRPGVRAGVFRIPRDEAAADAFYRIHLTVTDSASQSHASFRDVQPSVVTIAVNPSVPGLVASLDGEPMTAPFTFEAVAGSRHTLAADATQVVDGVTYAFRSWTGRRRAEFEFIVPGVDRTFELRYSSDNG